MFAKIYCNKCGKSFSLHPKAKDGWYYACPNINVESTEECNVVCRDNSKTIPSLETKENAYRSNHS